jgi:hypothetical protein
MSDDVYDDDILWWSEQQAELLRRVAAGEQADNIIEEIEAVEPTGPAVPGGGQRPGRGGQPMSVGTGRAA